VCGPEFNPQYYPKKEKKKKEKKIAKHLHIKGNNYQNEETV
jgi:hypothetical protein